MFLSPVHRSVVAPSGIIRDGLVGRWPMQEGAGGTAFDDSGNGNNGTLTNYDLGSCWVAGPGIGGLDSAIRATAQNQHVLIGDIAVLKPTAAVSISIWVWTDTISGGHVFSFNVGTNWGWGSANLSTGIIGDGTGDYYNNLIHTNVTTGRWYLYTLTFDGAWGRVYWDDAQVQSHNKSTAIIYGTQPCKINGRSDRTNDGVLCRVADARVYNRALTPAEVAQIYSGNG